MNFPDLHGKRIDLVAIDPAKPAHVIDDMDVYSRMPEFFTYLEYSEHKTRSETERYYEKLLVRSQAEIGYYWLVKLAGEDKTIGTFGVLDIDVRKGMAEIGYGLSPNYWGQGYFRETMNLVLG
ncbi:MAG: GNAT family N-acetyltransferase, partial [Rhodospirillales bacterium]|nr:GNAT family N-acetyltransferase [Rhodospirillales bacterium]